MVQRGDGLSLALKAHAAFRVSSHARRQHFDCKGSIEPRVARTIDLTHATRAQQTENVERPQPATDQRRRLFDQRLRRYFQSGLLQKIERVFLASQQ